MVKVTRSIETHLGVKVDDIKIKKDFLKELINNFKFINIYLRNLKIHNFSEIKQK